ncbi:serine/threonine protein kinase [Labilithrix luteola]|uniref:Serine/threonine protein kinase n=1 Tax=Labilithrix luteola TaxID=1391654 RepID=A0A0K1Q9N9_9BACT|nr:serine/threonine protein kinase [Labilithrix luteola]
MKVVDFGIAKTRDSTVETRTGVLKGKPGYMAPEQISGDVDARSDVYSAAVMLWEAVVGRRMWQGKGDVEVLANILRGQTPALREVKPDVDERIASICDKGLAKDREERYHSAQALADDIDAYMAEKGLVVSPREIGKVVSEIFAEERERTRATIDAYLQSLRSGIAQAALPRIRSQAPETITPSGNSNSNRLVGTGTLPSVPNGPTSANQPTPAGIEFINPSLVPAYAPDHPRKKSRTGLLLVAGGVVLGALAAFGFVLSKKPGPNVEATQALDSHTSEESGAPAAAAPIPPPVTATATGPSTHELHVKVTPPVATVSFDGVTYANPAKTTCRHGTSVLMRANATGYSARERKIDCDKDESLELVLSPLAVYVPPRAQPAPAPAPSPTQAPASTPASAAAKTDCNPPFYFQGTKKVFKPGCL